MNLLEAFESHGLTHGSNMVNMTVENGQLVRICKNENSDKEFSCKPVDRAQIGFIVLANTGIYIHFYNGEIVAEGNDYPNGFTVVKHFYKAPFPQTETDVSHRLMEIESLLFKEGISNLKDLR